MTIAHILGFPRIGKHRELKKAVEDYWAGKITEEALLTVGKNLRSQHWEIQRKAGLDFITVGDFSWYDHVLDTAVMLGMVPSRFEATKGENIDLDTLFLMARGACRDRKKVVPLEMTKWFDTNYHYIVPELAQDQSFYLADQKLFDEVNEAKALNLHAKPVMLGPLTFLWLAKGKEKLDKLSLLGDLLAVYEQIFNKLKKQNIQWVQIDEPILGLNIGQAWVKAFESAYARLAPLGIKVLLTSYFSGLAKNAKWVCQLPVQGIHVDLVRAPIDWNEVLKLSSGKVLSAGIVDGRNIWRNDIRKSYQFLQEAKERLHERLWVGTSCSLLHTPVDLNEEVAMENEIKSWLSFSVQKIEEVVAIAKALDEGGSHHFERSDQCIKSRLGSSRVHLPHIKERQMNLPPSMFSRQSPYAARALKQKKALNLPLLPTTTIGSFPQTQDIRHIRHELKAGELSWDQYEKQIQRHIKETVEAEEELDLDVLVHGEPERNDMVEYFGELLDGFAFTQNGWVQSYGSRCVKPPIIYGDVSRKEPMTVSWSKFAQSLTDKPVKGMLTGPVTMLCWSFVRDDQARAKTAMQIALVLRDEIEDLEKAGITIIQIDEPAFREGLPLDPQERPAYLEWAVNAFRLATSGVKDTTQIHTHMCYSEFNDVIEAIAAMDADVITIETSRSKMELLRAFQEFQYPNEIGPGIYDIHSPRIPTVDEILGQLNQAAKVIPLERLWVNPDCGLKTRSWPEVKEALTNMVIAAKKMRANYERSA